jgi:UDP-N-acetylglucosamine 1-carboxyvinyltransferase
MAATWHIDPVGPLLGDVMVRGSKNAVTKHMVAALLADGPCIIQNCPEIGEIEITTGML